MQSLRLSESTEHMTPPPPSSGHSSRSEDTGDQPSDTLLDTVRCATLLRGVSIEGVLHISRRRVWFVSSNDKAANIR